MEAKTFNSSMKEDLIDFFEKVYDYMGYSLELGGKDSDLKNIKENYKNSGGEFWVIYRDKKIIGTIGLRKVKDKIGELKRFYVLPEFQGEGYGKFLLETILKAARKKYEYLRLDTTKKSERAIYLFKKYDFYEIERYNDDPYAEIFMERKLLKKE